MYRCWFSLLWHYVLALRWLLHWSLLIPLSACSICLCGSSLFRASSRLGLAFVMTSVTFCYSTASGLFCRCNWWYECKQYNNKWRCHSSQTCLRKNTTNSLLYFCFVQSVTCKLDLRRERYKQKQPLIKMSQLTDVFTLVFILLVDCNWQNLKKELCWVTFAHSRNVWGKNLLL